MSKSINFRKMMVPKREPLFIQQDIVTSIHPIQQHMMSFYKENNRCVINAPRQVGKTTFLIMQAILSNKSVIILSHNHRMSEIIDNNLKLFCKNNKISYNDLGTQFGIQIKHKCILLATETNVDKQLMASNDYAIFIDEFDSIDIVNLPLSYITHAVLIGTTNGKSRNFTEAQIGLFAGLNINGDI